MTGIYRITNKATGECYVGKSKHVKERWTEHFSKGYGAMHSGKFQAAIDEYGKEGFTFDILEECDEATLHERERYWINALAPEYNTVTDGHSVSAETRARISASLTGRKQPPELVEKRRRSILERHKTHPQTNAGHKKKVAADIAGTVVFDSVKDAAGYLKVHASSVTKALKRRNGKAGGVRVWYVV